MCEKNEAKDDRAVEVKVGLLDCCTMRGAWARRETQRCGVHDAVLGDVRALYDVKTLHRSEAEATKAGVIVVC